MSKDDYTIEQFERNRQLLRKFAEKEENRTCADCTSTFPNWIECTRGIFICVNCAAHHRALGTHISKVKSLSLDKFTNEQTRHILSLGNAKSNEIYGELRMATNGDRRKWITNKYVYRLYYKEKQTEPKLHHAEKQTKKKRKQNEKIKKNRNEDKPPLKPVSKVKPIPKKRVIKKEENKTANLLDFSMDDNTNDSSDNITSNELIEILNKEPIPQEKESPQIQNHPKTIPEKKIDSFNTKKKTILQLFDKIPEQRQYPVIYTFYPNNYPMIALPNMYFTHKIKI